MKPKSVMKRRRNFARPFRDSGIAYKPKVQKKELRIQLAVVAYLKKHYPHSIVHSDFAAGADLSQFQSRLNSSLQSNHKFPDLIILTPSRGYCGLAIELKADNVTVILKVGPDKGKLTTNPHIRAQAETLRTLNDAGWYANFAVGEDEAIKMIRWYFNEPEQSTIF